MPDQINNKAVTEQVGLTGSVMDYPAVNLAADKSKQGQYFTTRPGPYDMWAIEYAYSPALPDAKAEAARLQKILSRSTDPQLIFGNDADDMRFPGFGIDPRVMIGDLSGDAISYSIDRIKLGSDIMSHLKERYITDDHTYQELRQAYLITLNEQITAAGVLSVILAVFM